MDKKEEKETLAQFDFIKSLEIEEEIYKYSAEDYNILLDEKPWKKEFQYLFYHFLKSFCKKVLIISRK